MQIDWWTLALQTINFLVLVWLLTHFLYRPVRQVIAERKALAEQALVDAHEAERVAESRQQALDEAIADAARQRESMLKEHHQALEAERAAVLDKAHEEARALTEAGRHEIAQERRAAERALREQASELAVELAAALLRSCEHALPGEFFVQRVEQELGELPAHELERLSRDLTANGGRLGVVTATALDSTEQDHWKTRLLERLGCQAPVDFSIDAELLAGVELHFPHSVLRYSWADQLSQARARLLQDDLSE
ncbi:MAG: F0F1 ATP synthase subunit delta [Gammaproteobacteria bacterium]|nr:F0F1 ATP synthase subunit delta [Gammaproteobacteria bacterium]